MFTDGLDPSALEWVQGGLKEKEKGVSTILPPSIDVLSPTVVRENVLPGGRKSGKGWGLPPTQLQSSHFHSGFLRPQFSASVDDDLNESVGSVSCDVRNRDYGDSSDSDVQGSGPYSVDSSPSRLLKVPAYHTEDDRGCYTSYDSHIHLNGVHLEACEVDDIYYGYDRRLLSSKPNSKSNSASNSRSESFGRCEGRQAQAGPKDNFAHESAYACGDVERARPTTSLPQQDCVRNQPKFSYDRANYSDEDSFGESGSGDEGCGAAEENLVCHGVASQMAGLRLGCEYTACEHSPSSLRSHRADGLEDLNTGQHPLRGFSENLGASPSAPPMTCPSHDEPSANAESFMPSLSESIGQTHSYSTDQKYSSVSRPAEPSATFTFGSEQRKQAQVTSDEHNTRPTFANEEEIDSSIRQTATSTSQPLSVHVSGHAAWQALIAYDACVRLCLRAWARGCMEASEFLINECSVLQESFRLQHVLLQPQEDVIQKLGVDDAAAPVLTKSKRDVGKIKVQVRKVRVFPCQGLQGSSSRRGAAYMQAGAQYMRHVSGLLKAGVNTLRSTTMMETQEIYSCLLKLKSEPNEEAIQMHPGSVDTHVFHPECAGDDLLLEVQDSKGNTQGRVLVQLASLSDDPNDQIRWWSIYNEPDHECVGKVQLFISHALNSSEASSNKWSPVGETLAYDIVLEVAMQAQHFQRRNLRLHGAWKWLLSEFALFYGVSNAYTSLRYLACIMEVATPTEDCLVLIYDLLCPILKAQSETALTRQEKRILADVQDQVEQLLAVVFENYKSLDESSPSGMTESFIPVSGKAAPALVPAVQIFKLLHDILSAEAQTTLCNYFQVAAKKRCQRHMAETDEFVSGSNEGFLMDPLTTSTAYSKMRTLCMNIRNEVQIDIDMHNQHILPSSIDLPNITAGVYGMELCDRLRAFMVACPPSSPSPPVVELLIATADFQRDLTSWNISPFKGRVDAKELFHLYIVLWIQEKRLNLLDHCKLDRVRWTGVATENGTSPFVEEMYDRIKDTLNEYDILLNRWPEYTFSLEMAVADVETAVVVALEKQYADVLMPLRDIMVPKKFSLQYMQKLTRRRSLSLYSVPNQLGIFLNTIKRLLDTLRPKIELQMKSWVACLPAESGGKVCFGERLNEVTVLLRAKHKYFVQAIAEKLSDNARLQGETKLKKILQDTREAGGESEIRDRMQPLSVQLLDTIRRLHDVFTTRVFVAICRGYWDRMGQDVLHFLENRKENRSWYKGSYFALLIVDDIFQSQMQKLQGHALQEKDLEPPRSVMEARSMLSKDAPNGLDSSNYFYF